MKIPTKKEKGLWESIDTTNDSWGFAKSDSNWKSPKDIIQNLISVVSKGGTYMLNIGPKEDGSIPILAKNTLEQTGTEILKYKEIIYGSKPSPFTSSFSWGDCVTKDTDLYVFVTNKSAPNRIILPGVTSKVTSAELLNSKIPVTIKQNDLYLKCDLPQNNNDELLQVVKISFSEKPKEFSSALLVDGINETTLETVFGEVQNVDFTEVRWMEKFGEWKYAEIITGWKTNESVATWNITIAKPGRYKVFIEYACDSSCENSEFEIKQNSQTCAFTAQSTGIENHLNRKRIKRYRFMNQGIGSLQFAQKGLTHIHLKSRLVKNDGAVFINKIILKPY